MSMDNYESSENLASRDLILILLFPPFLLEYEMRAPESIRVSLRESFVEIRDKNLARLIGDFKLISKLLPKYIKYNRGGRGVHVFRFVGRARSFLDRAYKLSRLARSMRKLLVSWIVLREIALQVIHKLYSGKPRELDLYIPLPDQAVLDYGSLRKYENLEDSRRDIIGIKFSEIIDVLHRHFADGFERLGGGKLKVKVELFRGYFEEIARIMSPERFELMNIICSNPPAYTYALINIVSEVLRRKKSWIYASIEALEKIGLIVRYDNIHPKARKRKRRVERIILPSCVAWKLAPCIIELPKYDIRIKVTKPEEFVCVRGYRENEVFTKPNIDTLEVYAESLQSLRLTINWESIRRLRENGHGEISRIPCPIFRYVMQILYDIARRALSLRDRGIKIERGRAQELSLNLIKIFNDLCRILGIEFEIEYEENENQ